MHYITVVHLTKEKCTHSVGLPRGPHTVSLPKSMRFLAVNSFQDRTEQSGFPCTAIVHRKANLFRYNLLIMSNLCVLPLHYAPVSIHMSKHTAEQYFNQHESTATVITLKSVE